MLKAAGHKLTEQRRSILALFERGSEHLTAAEVHDAVRSRDPEIGLTTVYRTLELLSDVGILRRVNFNDGAVRYERSLGSRGHHHHLVCMGCGKVIEFGECQIRSIEQRLAQVTGFKIEKHWLEVTGRCEECQK
jgi:Fur family ferric uptake transcriptional regulator